MISHSNHLDGDNTNGIAENDRTSDNNKLSAGHQTNLESSQVKQAKNPEMAKSALHMAFKAPANNNPKPESENVMVMAKYSAYWVNKKDNEKIYSVVVELPHLETVAEAIRDVLPLLNQNLAKENSPYKLVEDPNLFNLYKAKKTGHAKLDYPALDSSQILNQTGVQQISIVEKDNSAISLRSAAPVNISHQNTNNTNYNTSMMLDSTMPAGNSETSMRELNEEYVTEATCWCLEKKVKKVPKPANTNQNHVTIHPPNLSSSLLKNQ